MKRDLSKNKPSSVGNDRAANPPRGGRGAAPRVPVVVNGQGFVYISGVMVARCVSKDGKTLLRFIDKDRRRISERGTRYVYAAMQDLADALDAGPVVLDDDD